MWCLTCQQSTISSSEWPWPVFLRWISLQRALGSEHLLHLAFAREPLVDSCLVLETHGAVQELFSALAAEVAEIQHGENGGPELVVIRSRIWVKIMYYVNLWQSQVVNLCI